MVSCESGPSAWSEDANTPSPRGGGVSQPTLRPPRAVQPPGGWGVGPTSQAAGHATPNRMVGTGLASGIQMWRIFMAVENAHARAVDRSRRPAVPRARLQGSHSASGTIGANYVCRGRIMVARASLMVAFPSMRVTSRPEMNAFPSIVVATGSMMGRVASIMGMSPSMMVASPSEMVPSRPEVDRSQPEMNASPPEMDASRPERNASRLERNASRLERNASRPEMNASRLEMNASRPEMNASRPEMNASRPEMNAPRREMVASRREMVASRPEMIQSDVNGSGRDHCRWGRIQTRCVPLEWRVGAREMRSPRRTPTGVPPATAPSAPAASAA